MKKIICLVLIIAMLSACKQIDSCVNNDNTYIEKELLKENVIVKNIDKLVNDNKFECDKSLINTYKDILSNKATFCDMSSEKNLLLKDIKYSEYNLTPLNYTLVNMNSDCIPELVIEMKVGAADFVLVLHANAGNIVSYLFSNREIQEIKLDGTFMASGGAFDNGVYELKFVNDGYVINSVGHKESGHDKKGDFIISYYINNEKTTEENYKSFIENYDKKEDVVWYNFTKGKEF